MNGSLFFGVLGVMSVVSLWIGARSARGVKRTGDYLLAGRSLGAVPLALSVMATQIGGGIVIGTAEAAYNSGWGVILWPWGTALGLAGLGLGLGSRLRKLGVSSIPEIFEQRFGSRRLRLAASALSVAALFFVLVAQLIGLRKFLFAMGIGNGPLFIGIGVLVMAYTALGGLRAVVFTDILQTLFIGGVFGLVACVMTTRSAPIPEWGSAFGAVSWGGWFVAPFLFMLIGQDMGQRCFAGRSSQGVSRAFLWAALGVGLVGIVPVALGVTAAAMGLEVSSSSSVVLDAASALCGPVVLALVSVAVVVALLSSIDSLVCAVSSNLAVDFGIGKRVGTLKATSFAVGLAALIGGCLFDDVGTVMITSYELAVSCLAVPVLMAVLTKRTPKLAATFALAGGGLGFLLVRVLGIPGEFLSLGLSGAGYGAGCLLGRRAA